ncbi:isochorismatase family protein [Streptomyces aidingensis]|uniref:Bifunctional isochorismate lyase / aryl carrier protein n=1 Tax=Streptomyces aidingensis TaxID=910347 RepID=A0A1I1FFY1_9ACTN|nr:isochorismatase family protein [Streptomyces aidingensis]SFB98275.1 bifunctional isochorismate lyase / aryl carrier protein [Streptomyces aidingensis]
MQFSAGIPSITSYPLPHQDELPQNVAGWLPDPSRAVLLVHDMQRYFLRPLPSPGLRQELTANCARLRETCARAGVPVVYTAQPGGMTPQQRGLLRDFWGPGMRVEPADRRVAEPVAPGPDDTVLTKWRYSAFHRTGLLDRMREWGRDQLVICGVYAHVGILATAVEAFTQDIETFLAADAVADFSREHHMLTLDYAAGRCAVVATTGTLTARLRERAAAGDRPAAALSLPGGAA